MPPKWFPHRPPLCRPLEERKVYPRILAPGSQPSMRGCSHESFNTSMNRVHERQLSCYCLTSKKDAKKLKFLPFVVVKQCGCQLTLGPFYPQSAKLGGEIADFGCATPFREASSPMQHPTVDRANLLGRKELTQSLIPRSSMAYQFFQQNVTEWPSAITRSIDPTGIH